MREKQAVLRQPIEHRRLDFATVTADIRVPHVTSHDEHDVRLGGVAVQADGSILFAGNVSGGTINKKKADEFFTANAIQDKGEPACGFVTVFAQP